MRLPSLLELIESFKGKSFSKRQKILFSFIGIIIIFAIVSPLAFGAATFLLFILFSAALWIGFICLMGYLIISLFSNFGNSSDKNRSFRSYRTYRDVGLYSEKPNDIIPESRVGKRGGSYYLKRSRNGNIYRKYY